MNKIFKSKYLIMILSLVMCLSFTNFNVLAAENESEDNFLVNDPIFIKNAEIVKTKDGDATIITLKHTTYENTVLRSKTAEQQAQSMTAQFIAYDDDEINAIENGIKQAQTSTTRGSSQQENDDWFYGSSLYLETTIYYSTKTNSNGQTGYKITSVKAKCSVNNGTTISSRKLQLHAYSTDLDGNMFLNTDTYDISSYSNPATFTAPSSWPYLINTTPLLGVEFHCTVYRGTSEKQTFSLPNTLFVNM